MATVTWHGTQREFTRLQRAVAEHCECLGGMFGLPPRRCAAHDMLTEQSALDHMLYVYRTKKQFITREMYAMPARSRAQVKTAA
jgi:hypothetical protein